MEFPEPLHLKKSLHLFLPCLHLHGLHATQHLVRCEISPPWPLSKKNCRNQKLSARYTPKNFIRLAVTRYTPVHPVSGLVATPIVPENQASIVVCFPFTCRLSPLAISHTDSKFSTFFSSCSYQLFPFSPTQVLLELSCDCPNKLLDPQIPCLFPIAASLV